MFLIGLFALAGYWYWVHPPGFARGYLEDFGNNEMARQLVSESLRETGWPAFRTDRVMAPFGLNLVYFTAWNLERDWIGGWVYLLNREFPFPWVHFGFSLLMSYLGAGFFLGKMGLSRVKAWSLALFTVLLNLPRHSKIWYHADNTLLHWFTLGVFFDAWLWQKFVRERRVDIRLEGWRLVLLAATLMGPGYSWGPTFMAWVYVRMAMLVAALVWRARGDRGVTWIVEPRRWTPVFLAGAAVSMIDLLWFLPLAKAVMAEKESVGHIFWYFTKLGEVFYPSWLQQLSDLFGLHRFLKHAPQAETYPAMGWAYWGLWFWSVGRSFKVTGGQGVKTFAPFLALVVAWVIFYTLNPSGPEIVSFGMPFMSLYRTVCRIAVYLPVVMAATVGLVACEKSSPLLGRRFKLLAGVWGCMAAAEATFLLRPVISPAAMPEQTQEFFSRIKAQQGDTVLSMPFCVAGGNGICTPQQCAQYPASTVSHAFRVFHDKKVYGAYSGRNFYSTCDIYGGKDPYEEWFDAWRQNRCLRGPEWDDLCRYLERHSELSALLLLPDVWTALRDPACQAALQTHLGAPRERASYVSYHGYNYQDPFVAEVRWYEPKCKK